MIHVKGGGNANYWFDHETLIHVLKYNTVPRTYAQLVC